MEFSGIGGILRD